MPGTVYFVTDIEADGPDPSRNSMLSFASVAVRRESGVLGSFERTLQPRADRSPDEDTLKWWRSQPEAYRAATADAVTPDAAMTAFADWVGSFPRPRAFAARPLLFDGMWMDEYLKTFARTRIFGGPFKGRQIFDEAGVDIPSLMGGMFGWDYRDWSKSDFPSDWLGGREHTHRAIDDALGYAHLLLKLLRISSAQAAKPEDFRRPPN